VNYTINELIIRIDFKSNYQKEEKDKTNMNSIKNISKKIIMIFLTSFLIYACYSSDEDLLISITPQLTRYTKAALSVTDYILEQQNEDGAIPDRRNGSKVNEDSNMEYCLIGLASAYWFSKDQKYLDGLEKGIEWLAAREEMNDEKWSGSWWYTYTATPPYDHIPTSPGGNVTDVRGVDATSTLFAYIVYLHSVVAGNRDMADKYEANAKAGLDFVLRNNRSSDNFFMSSWQKANGTWKLWKYRYAADQADVYLGMKAGELLYSDAAYSDAAAFLQSNVPSQFFSVADGRYGTGRYMGAPLDVDDAGFDIIFPQGYLPWAFGQNTENNIAWKWLQSKEQEDGSIPCYDNDLLFSLTIAVYSLGAKSLNYPATEKSLDWLIENNIDEFGGVRDNADPTSPVYANVIGFSTAGLLSFPAFQ